MAQKSVVSLIDDLTQSEADQTVEFGLDGVTYEIDLSDANTLPSLHLNLAECFRKLAQHDHAREHLQLGYRSVDDLPAGEYGDTIRGALAALAQRLDRG